MDIREYSSGGKHNRFGITKQGLMVAPVSSVRYLRVPGRSGPVP